MGAHGGIQLFLKDGKGDFRFVSVAAYPPSWGSSDLELADFDGDGDLDIALGGYYRGPGVIPPDIKSGWEKTRASIAVLISHAR